MRRMKHYSEEAVAPPSKKIMHARGLPLPSGTVRRGCHYAAALFAEALHVSEEFASRPAMHLYRLYIVNKISSLR